VASGLDSLSPRPAAYTPESLFVRGNYTIGTESLSYYAVAMPVEQARSILVLARDIVLDPMAPIKMDELFQRELNEERATGEITEYLRQPRQPKFFNALTVVVLPMEPEHTRRVAHSYEQLADRPPSPTDAAYIVNDIGPVRIRKLAANNEVGYISWDSKLARAVIVDGQHRFFAVDHLMRDNTFPYRADLAATTLPVLLLVLDRRAGFTSANEARFSVVQTCRALFIDLNKHAQLVSSTRQYLLDDRDLTAVSMRHIMSGELGGSTETVAIRVAISGTLPLALVDWWHEAKNQQLATGPYVTATIALYPMVQAALGVVAPTSSTDYASLRDYVAKLVARLELDGNEGFDEEKVRREIDRAEESGLPYSLDNERVGVAAEGFRRTVGMLVVQPLSQLRAYAELVKEYETEGLLSGEFEQWLGLDKAGKDAFAEETGTNPEEGARLIYERVKPKYRLAYQLVFQKAFVGAAIEMDQYRSEIMARWQEPGGDERGAFVDAWIRRFDSVFTAHLNVDEAWAGAGVTPQGTISWTQPSQRAITGFVVYSLLAPLREWTGQSSTEQLESAREWLRDAWSKAGAGRPSATIDGLYKVGGAWKRSVSAYVRAQFKLRDEDRTPDDEDALEHGAKSLVRLVAGLPGE
jgi:DGQHR domain-containing protein